MLFRCHGLALVGRNGKGVAVGIGAFFVKQFRKFNGTPFEQFAVFLQIRHGRNFPHAIDHERCLSRSEQSHG